MNEMIKINMVVMIIVVFMMVEAWRILIVLWGGRYLGNDRVDMKIAKHKQQLN